MPDIVLYSSTGCPYCEKIKNDLQTWGFSYKEKNVTENPGYFNDLHEKGIFSTPVVFIDEEPFIGYRPNKMKKYLGVTENKPIKANRQHSSPSVEDIFTSVNHEVLNTVYDFVIIGGGPAGASAAVYASRARLKTLVIDKSPAGGTLAITHKIANYPGVREELTGLELLSRMQAQAKEFGAEFVRSRVIRVDFSDPEIKRLEVPEGIIQAKSVFIAVGAKAPSSKIKGEETFTGRGVSYCSTCDAAFFKGKTVVVMGDTEEAVQETQALSRFCKEVRLLVPAAALRGEADITPLQDAKNVAVYWKHRIKEIRGDKSVENIVVQNDQKAFETWKTDGVFLYLAGMKPGTDFLHDAVQRDDEGYIIVDDRLHTSAAGVFAGGDARRTPIKQAVISAADGAVAALGADQYVHRRSKLRPQYS